MRQVDWALLEANGHKRTPLGPAERDDLAQITRHPGMDVLIERIMEGHVRAQLENVHKVKLDYADRRAKIDAICAVSTAMRLSLEIIKGELEDNWKTIQDAEISRKKNEMEKIAQ